jgi:hypothetical protein
MELALLKRMLRLGVKHGKVLRVPSIEFLKEAPPREGSSRSTSSPRSAAGSPRTCA